MIGGDSMKTEEKYPLLLVYLEEGDVKNNRRSDRIAAGATAVITRWPNDITASCWLGLLLFGLTLFLFFLMALTISIEHPHLILTTINNKQELKCIKPIEDNSFQDHIYLAHTSSRWSIREYNTLNALLKHYRDYNITLVILKNCSNNYLNSNHTKNTTEHKFHKLLKEYNKLEIVHYSCSDYFKNTSLSNCWRNLNSHMINFAARVFFLWEHSGMSFNLKTKLTNETFYLNHPRNKRNSDTLISNHTSVYVINKNGVRKNKTSEYKLVLFPNMKLLPNDAVTLDINGHFIATRTLCHSFFEQVIQQMKSHCNQLMTVQRLITDSIRVFCKQGGVEYKYCDITKY